MERFGPAVAIVFLAVAATFMGGCVSQQELDELKGLNMKMSEQLVQMESERDKALADNAKLKAQVATLIKDLAIANVEASKWKEMYNATKESLDNALAQLKKPQPETGMEEWIKALRDAGFEVREGRAVLPSDIYFDSGKVTLKKGVSAQLGKIAEIFLQKGGDAELAVEGHTDNVPIKFSKWADNWQLSCERARAILKILDKEGVPAPKMHIVGNSMHKPVAENSTKTGRSKNRRVELRLVPMPLAVE